VELHAVHVAENIGAAEEVRTDVDGNWWGSVDPRVPAETCDSVGCLSRFPSVHEERVGDGTAAPHGDDVELSTEKEIDISNFIFLNLIARCKEEGD
jgi:hypothetical protein